MESIVLALVLVMCLWIGVREYNAEEPSKVFAKYGIQVTDVKKYNQFCGILIIAFGVLASITIALMMAFEGLVTVVFFALIILESYVVIKVYQKGEKKFLKKR